MTMIDVIPVGGRHFLVQLRRMASIPDHIGFDRYYEGTLAIELADGSTIRQECFVYRPKNRRNVVGIGKRTGWCFWSKPTLPRRNSPAPPLLLSGTVRNLASKR